MSGSRLAVDLGTSHTVAVIERAGQPARPLLFDGSPVLPSGVFAAGDGAIHTGRDAERLAQIEPHRFEPHPKQRVDEGTILLGDAEYPVAVLLAAILGRVLQEAGLAHGSTVVLTCPADWGRVRRAVLIEAARRAGIADPVLVDEPVAAAAYCTRVLGSHVPAGQSLLVFDFGGGTLDLALVRLDPAGTRVTGVGGLQNLGGLDVDSALVGHLGQLLGAHDPALWHRLQHPAGPADLRDRRAFWDEVRVAKEMLSRTTRAPVPVPGGGPPLHLTREEVERLAGPLIDRAVDETRRLLDGVSRQTGGVSLAGILLVGGSSRIPLVATRLHGRFGVGPMVPEQPELPVALGALATLGDAPGAAGQGGAGPAGYGGAGAGGYGGPAAGPGGYGAPAGSPNEPVSGPQRPVSGPAGAPVSGPVGVSVSGPITGVPVSAVPVSGDPGRAWAGQPAAQTGGAFAEQPSWPPVNVARPGLHPGTYGQPPPLPARRRGPRGATLIAIAASVALLVLAGATIWFVRDALGDKGGGNGSRGNTPAAAIGASGGPSVASSDRGPAPSGFVWCDTLGKAVLCGVETYCEDANEDEVACAEAHTLQTFVAGPLPPGAGANANKINERPEVKAVCTEEMLAARSIDPAKTKGWQIYSQWGSINVSYELFYCHAGPRTGTVKGNSFKPAA